LPKLDYEHVITIKLPFWYKMETNLSHFLKFYLLVQFWVGPVSRKRIQSHQREPRWTCISVRVMRIHFPTPPGKSSIHTNYSWKKFYSFLHERHSYLKKYNIFHHYSQHRYLNFTFERIHSFPLAIQTAQFIFKVILYFLE